MIKIDVIVKDKNWLKFIKNPDNYLKRKIKKIQKNKFFKKNNYYLSVQLSSNKKIYLGDIIINYKKIKKNSKTVFKNHFDILWIHGLVHLFGYEHQKDHHYKKMLYIEKKLLNNLND